MNHVVLLQIAGILQLLLLAAGATMPHAVKLREHLSTLPSFIRRLFWVYYAFIGLHLAGFGILTWWRAEGLLAGTPLARGLCGFLALFWGARLLVTVLVFDVRPYLTNGLYKLGHYAINAVFTYLTAVFTWAAW